MSEEREFTKAQELSYELKVGEVMKKEVITVRPDNTMGDLRELLKVHRISGAPVVDEERLVGIISIEDLIGSLANGEIDRLIEEKMTCKVEIIFNDELLVHAIEKFKQYGFGRFPVIDRENGKLVGILTKGDIIQGLLKRLEVVYEEEAIHRYRASHFFEDIIADKTTLNFTYHVNGSDFERAGEAASSLKKTLSRLGIHPRILRRIAVATYEAEMNVVIYTEGGVITAKVEQDKIRIIAMDPGPGIPNIEKALEPGFSTAPEWVRELGFGAGMGLPNIKRCADEFRINSEVGKGTQLEVVFYIEQGGLKNET